MASTGSKSPNLLEKRLTMGKDVRPVSRAAVAVVPSSPGRALLGSSVEAVPCDSERELASYVALSWPVNGLVPGGAEASPGERQMSAGSENSIRRKSPARTPREDAGVRRRTSDRAIPPENSFDALLTCISDVLGKDDGFYDLEITPVLTKGGGMPGEEKPPEAVATPQEGIFMSPEPSLTFHEDAFRIPQEYNIASVLIGEIDLHVELENYLRAIDGFNSARNRTKTTLQRGFLDDPDSVRTELRNLQNRTDEFFEVTEIKSSSTFASASSVCTQQDGDTNRLHVFLDRKHDMASVSEENLDARNTKVFISQTQFTDKVGDIRKIKSDNDPKKVLQEYKMKSSIKRTFGKTSFQSLRPDEERAWVMPPFVNNSSNDSTVDCYEKILPFETILNRSSEEVKKRSSVLFTNSGYSLSADSLSATVRKAASDSDRCQELVEEDLQLGTSKRANPVQLTEETTTSSMALEKMPKSELDKWKWSPSLQELIEIYNSVLKHNKKLKSNSRTSVSRCMSSHLISFLNEELKEKELKANLVMLSKALQKKLKTPKVWNPGKLKKDNTLVEYVAIFQEILQSSLTISQIARLNNIISGLQDYSERNYEYVKNLQAGKKRQEKPKKPETVSGLEEQQQKVKQKNAAEKPKTGRSQKSPSGRKQSPLNPKQFEKKENPQITTVELAKPTELESMLQSCFTSTKAERKSSKETDEKVLVTVKLCGSQVLVSGLSYFKNEKALSPKTNRQNGTSELIIESVTREQFRDVCNKKTVNTKPNEGKNTASEKPKSEMKAKPEMKKVKRKPKTSATTPHKQSQPMERSELPQKKESSPLQFEYDQMKLRAQHPIEAIIESSESKISEHIGSSDDELLKHDTPPEKKILLKDMQKTTTLKEALKEALAENVFSKDLTCDFGWDDSAVSGSLARTKSFMMNREVTKKQVVPKKQAKNASTVRSLNDLKNGTKRKRKPRRPTSSYLCYPTITEQQERTSKQKPKKLQKQKSRSLCSSNSRSSDCGLSAQQHVSKRSSKELNSKTHKPDAPSDSDDKPTENSPVNTVVFINNSVIPDHSTEMLFFDSKNTCTSDSSKTSASTIKQSSKASSEIGSFPVRLQEPGRSEPTAATVDALPEAPIVIHAPRSDADDLSFPSVMIHSDSFLKYYSSLPLTPGNLSSLLKSSSDMKFYPGRVNSNDRESTPFVKFVLTPTQNAQAELPANQVVVVDKNRAPDFAVVENRKEPPKDNAEEVNEQISLPSIEKFIQQLSKSKKSEKTKDRAKADETAKQKKTAVHGEKSRHRPSDRKPYHECQKRKLSEFKAKGKPPERAKPKEKQEPEVKNAVDVFSLRDFILAFSNVMESHPKTGKETGSEGEDAASPVVGADAATAPEKSHGLEKATNTGRLLTAVPADISLQEVKSANTQTDDVFGSFRLSERSRSEEDLGSFQRRQKMLKSKSNCDDCESAAVGTEKFASAFASEASLLESFPTEEAEGKDVDRRKSMYFDADDSMRVWQSERPDKDQQQEFLAYWVTVDLPNLNRDLVGGIERKKSKRTPSPGRVYTDSITTEHSMEMLFDEILSSLQEGDICHSLVLLDKILRKVEYTPSLDSDSDRLSNVLLLVGNESKNVMTSLEKSAWVKVLSLLDDVTRMCGGEGVNVTRSAEFIGKVQKLNDRRLLDLKRFCSSMSLPDNSSNLFTSFYNRIANSFNYLRNRISARRSRFAHSIQSPLPDVSEKNQLETPLQRLRKQIQQQKTYIEFLMNTDCGLLPEEVDADVKSKVLEKMKSFERLLSATDAPTRRSWRSAVSLLSLAKTCRSIVRMGGSAPDFSEPSRKR